MKLLENIKGFFTGTHTPVTSITPTTTVNGYGTPISSYFDQGWMQHNIHDTHYNVYNQRAVALYPEVMVCLEEIMRELVDPITPLSTDCLEIDTDKLVESIYIFNNTSQSKIYRFVRQVYIDGEVFLVKLSKDKIEEIIKSARHLRLPQPTMDYHWVPVDVVNCRWNTGYGDRLTLTCRILSESVEVDNEDVIYHNFGLTDVNGENFGYLQYAIKYANQLRDLQDMLIPLRLKRSLARRIFKVDVGDLPDDEAEKYINDIREKFKYKRWYNNETGKIESNGAPVTLVEDYFLSHRGNEKGVELDTVSENKSNTEDMEDIFFINKKLYYSLMIPQRRVDPEYEYSVSSKTIDNEERRFQCYLDTIRATYNAIFDDIADDLFKQRGVTLRSRENPLSQEFIADGLDLFNNIKPYIGTLFSLDEAMKLCFNKSIHDVQNIKTQVENDLKDEFVAGVYEILKSSEDNY